MELTPIEKLGGGGGSGNGRVVLRESVAMMTNKLDYFIIKGDRGGGGGECGTAKVEMAELLSLKVYLLTLIMTSHTQDY